MEGVATIPKISNVRIYDRALTDREIDLIFSDESGTATYIFGSSKRWQWNVFFRKKKVSHVTPLLTKKEAEKYRKKIGALSVKKIKITLTKEKK